MKFPNYLKNAFAGLGVVSLFFYTCAAADEIASDNNDNPPSMSSEVYQISAFSSGSGSYLVALNNETGVVKTYIWTCNGGAGCDWLDYQANGIIPHNDLTITH